MIATMPADNGPVWGCVLIGGRSRRMGRPKHLIEAGGCSWLERTVQEGDVVVTHHLPSRRSVAPQFAGDPLNAFFLCDMERLILARQPLWWIHGHTHHPFDYQLGQTRVVANPRGYPSEARPDYVPVTLSDVDAN